MIHKTLHDRKSETGALIARGRVKRLHSLFDIGDADAFIADPYGKDVALDIAFYVDLAYLVGIGMDDAVGNDLADRCLDIADFLDRRVKNCRKGRNNASQKTFVYRTRIDRHRKTVFCYHLNSPFCGLSTLTILSIPERRIIL